MVLMEMTGLVEPDPRPTTFKDDLDLPAPTVDAADCFACGVLGSLHDTPFLYLLAKLRT